MNNDDELEIAHLLDAIVAQDTCEARRRMAGLQNSWIENETALMLKACLKARPFLYHLRVIKLKSMNESLQRCKMVNMLLCSKPLTLSRKRRHRILCLLLASFCHLHSAACLIGRMQKMSRGISTTTATRMYNKHDDTQNSSPLPLLLSLFSRYRRI